MLLLDAGNSVIKAQWWRRNALQYSFACRTEIGWQPGFDACVREVDVSQCHYCAGQVDQLETDFLTSLGKIFKPQNIHKFASLRSNHGVINAYQSAQGLGVDRWLCLLAADNLVARDAMIVDAGSAITVDLLRSDGQHLGGAILPGFSTSVARFRQILHRVDFEHPDISKNDEPGSSTEACIHIDYGPTNETILENLIDRWFERLAPHATLIVTGGDAVRIKSHRFGKIRIIPDLVFQGMRRQLDIQE